MIRRRGQTDAPQIAKTLASHFTDCDAGLEGIVDNFLKELHGESLIIPAEKSEQVSNGAVNGAPVKLEKFIRPALKKFTDMQADLNRERATMTRLWAKREEQLSGVLDSTAGLYGDLQNIAKRTTGNRGYRRIDG